MFPVEVTFKQDFQLHFTVTGNRKFINTLKRAENFTSNASWWSYNRHLGNQYHSESCENPDNLLGLFSWENKVC